jgi:peptidoglycan/xylan/chitin deacetylase (PgdA/CDA1 family)
MNGFRAPFAFLGTGVLLGLAGCGRRPAPVVTPHPTRVVKTGKTPVPRTLTAEQLKQIRPNEAGLIPILEYHEIGKGSRRMARSVKQFRHDLERLYRENYRPIALRDYLNNRIDLPAGKAPVLLTFDDGRESQCRYRPDGSLDPDCALGILQDFHKKRPDFPVKATFYILPRCAFGQPKWAKKKLRTLLQMGCEVGNHTVTHRQLNRLPDTEVQEELARCTALIHKIAPQARVDTIALPGGHLPRNSGLLACGKWEGFRYTHRAALLAGGNPAVAPVRPDFQPMRIPRILAVEERLGVTFWLDKLQTTRYRRYISDGDPKTVTVPRSYAKLVDTHHLNGLRLRTY